MPPPVTNNATPNGSFWSNLLRAFKNRNYRLFFIGQLISLIGTWLTTTTVGWFVYRLTGKTSMLGVVGFAGQIPAFALSPFAGVLVDRWQLHRTLVVTQVLSLLQSAGLAVLVFLALPTPLTVNILIGLLIFQGLINAFDIPARQAFVVQMVDDVNDLPNAIALNSSMFNLARLLGPGVAGVLIASVGEGWCFTIDAFSYVAVIVGLLMMRLKPVERGNNRKHLVREFGEGLSYAFSFPPIRAILLLLASVSLLGVAYATLVPVYAKDVLHGSSLTYGLLTSATGCGAFVGAIFLAARKSVLGLGRIIPTATLCFGLAIIAFAYSTTLWFSVPLMAVIGFCLVSQMASGNTLLQTIVEHDKRGRVMSLFAMSFQGMMPLGALLFGILAEPHRLGPAWALTLGGAGCILAALAFLAYLPTLRTHIRPIYVKRGILPEVASGLQTATNSLETRES